MHLNFSTHSKLSCKYLFSFLLTLIIFQSPLRGKEKTNICIVLTVYNDADVIQQCLSSAADIADCLFVFDTGSTDNTIEFIQDFCSASSLQYRIQRSSKANNSRTFALEAAQNFLKELGFELQQSYFLILDPDTVLKKTDFFKKDTLNEDAYLILEKASALSYYVYQPHLLRASLPWESRGNVHPYWSSNVHHKIEKLTNIRIEENIGDDRKKNKLKANLSLLIKLVKDQPNNLSATFSLAQTYQALKQYDLAIQWYRTRIQLESGSEEAWLSRYMLAECHQEVDQWTEALYWYLEAYQANPKRAESLRRIATQYRLRGENVLAYLFAKHGSLIPFPNDQTLFPHPPVQLYQFDEEISISSFYTRFKGDGVSACDSLILTKENVPWHVKEQAHRNILFYTQNLKARFYPINIDLPLIQEEDEEHYHPMNPSIQKTENGYKLILRAVNYTQIGAKIFNTIDKTGVFRTRNFLADLDKDFQLLSKQEIIEDLSRKRYPAFNVEGLEDCRLFTFKDRYWFTCTTCDTNPVGDRQISLCLLDQKNQNEVTNVETLTPLLGPDPARCEKNWLPFIKDGELFVIYSYDPFVIYKPDFQTGACHLALYQETEHDFSSFRGSAAPIVFDDGYLMLVHEVVILPEYYRCYLHRFLYLDRDFKILRRSGPFTFMHQGVEYCCAMTIDHSEKQLILPIGIEDREAYLCLVDLDTVRDLLLPLPPYVDYPFGH
jgi:tetratricopeptide (TPR) repeat protein